jgi:hypothetical protein
MRCGVEKEGGKKKGTHLLPNFLPIILVISSPSNSTTGFLTTIRLSFVMVDTVIVRREC